MKEKSSQRRGGGEPGRTVLPNGRKPGEIIVLDAVIMLECEKVMGSVPI